MMKTERKAEGGVRVLPGALVVGDFIRFDHYRANPDYCDRWWKVTAIEGRKITVINSGGCEMTFTPSVHTSVGSRIKRHPYSQKQHETKGA